MPSRKINLLKLKMSRKFNIAPEQMLVGRLLSYWVSVTFQGAILNFRGVVISWWGQNMLVKWNAPVLEGKGWCTGEQKKRKGYKRRRILEHVTTLLRTPKCLRIRTYNSHILFATIIPTKFIINLESMISMSSFRDEKTLLISFFCLEFHPQVFWDIWDKRETR